MGEDVEIKRFFCSDEEIEEWLYNQKEQREKLKMLEEEEDAKKLHMKIDGQQKKFQDSESDTMGSSLSSSDSEEEDELHSVSQQLLSIDANLNNSLDNVDVYSPSDALQEDDAEEHEEIVV